ncbi:MAG: ATP-binding protein [Ferruginibacter sp.]
MQDKGNEIIVFIVVITIILLFLLSFIAAVLFLYQKKNILYYKQLEDVKNNYEKNILETQLEIQEQTFHDIGREIHDNIGLSLTLAKLQLNTIQYKNPDKTFADIESSIELISKAINDLSDISKSLNSEAIKTQGLYNALKVEITKITRAGNHTIAFVEEGNIVFLDPNKELILYRIAQEVLNNILKHASASKIWINLVYDITTIKLTITDNGIGFEPSETEKCRTGKLHTGLNNIRTRTATLNGVHTIKSSSGNGTIISITAPY